MNPKRRRATEDECDLLLDITRHDVQLHLKNLTDAATAMAPHLAAIVASLSGDGHGDGCDHRRWRRRQLSVNFPLMTRP